jgi:signal transduction histidine kinase
VLRPEDPVSAALLQISRELPGATRREQIWKTIENGRRRLAEDVRLDVYFRDAEDDDFRPLVLAEPGSPKQAIEGPAVDAGDPLAVWMERERRAVSRSYLERERGEAPREHGFRAGKALRRFDELDLRVAVPLIGGQRLAGWIGLGRTLGERYVTAEVAAALQAVGQQALASLERIEALEAARRKESLAAVGELAAGLAHEVRNPVAAIRGAAQALGPAATETQQAEMLEVIAEETERLGRFAGEFLEYARPASPRRQPVDLAGTARGSIRRLEASGLRIAVELDCASDVPPLPADPEQLHRIFDNLIRNAAEAAGERGRLRIEIRRAARQRVAIRFEDNGPGIQPEQIRLLFQPFHSAKPGGTGLGLALVHRIVEAHGGEIRVEGRPGIGARFTVLLPQAAVGAGDDAKGRR